MIEPAKNTEKVVNHKGTTQDIIKTILFCYNNDYQQVKPLCQRLKGTVKERCRLIFDLINEHVQYQIDPFRRQWIRTPARLWSDGRGDCKSIAIFIASCMRCMRIKHVFRFASYTANPEPTHVYVACYDEGGREIIVDPIFRVDGVSLFNQECKYVSKMDIAGTTEISYLAGIGYPGEQKSVISPGTGGAQSRREVDLVYNLNLLNQLYEIEREEKDSSSISNILNLMDLCSMAISCFNLEKEGLINIDQGLTYLLSLYKEGKGFNLPASASKQEREIALKVIYGNIVTESENHAAEENSFFEIYALTGANVVDNLMSYSEISVKGIGDINSGYAQWEADFNSIVRNSADVYKAIEILQGSAAYFMYTFIPDSELLQYKPIVREKRAEHIKILNRIQKANILTVAQCEATIFLQIRKDWKMTPKQFLENVENGTIPVIGGFIEILVAVIGVIVSLLAGIAPLITKNKSELDGMVDDIQMYAPSNSDGVFTSADGNFDFTGTTGSGFQTAGQSLLPMLLVGGLVVGIALSDKDTKKKKKK